MVVDSSALVAILRDEPEGRQFSLLIARAPRVLVSAPTILETSMVIEGYSQDDIKAREQLDALIASIGLIIVPFDEMIIPVAREAFRSYGKGRHPAKLNFGDCISYATAKHYREPLLYKGKDLGLTDVVAAAGV